ncbi:MAG: NADH-quinone oxidoreductase subunit H, partial [Planctomycetes bacterium]|nr:NADH-quinone oxidoreductase subunit H [Planctomycetota bacterium]
MTELERRKEKKRRQNFAAVVNAFEEGALVEAVSNTPMLGERTGFESNQDVLMQYYSGADDALGSLMNASAFKHTVEQELSNTKAKVFLNRPWFGTPAYVGAGLFFILAISSISTMGVVLAGWGSNNKWALYGAIREAAQMVSY